MESDPDEESSSDVDFAFLPRFRVGVLLRRRFGAEITSPSRVGTLPLLTFFHGGCDDEEESSGDIGRTQDQPNKKSNKTKMVKKHFGKKYTLAKSTLW